MSRVVPLAVVLLIPAALGAAPVPAPPAPPGRPLTEAQRAEADIFAPVLVNVCNQIVLQYVRPVARHDVLHAALAGLYERARLTPPGTLRSDCERAVDDEAVVKLIVRVRADVGDAESLHGTHPLLICCQAMARSLDPYTGVVSGEEQRRNTGLEQDNSGVGL